MSDTEPAAARQLAAERRTVRPHPLRFGATMLPPPTVEPDLIYGPGWLRGLTYGQLVERLADPVGGDDA